MDRLSPQTGDILVEFLQVAITSIVFLKGIYPSGAFERRQYMNLVVHRARHPQLNHYIHNTLDALLPYIQQKQCYGTMMDLESSLRSFLIKLSLSSSSSSSSKMADDCQDWRWEITGYFGGMIKDASRWVPTGTQQWQQPPLITPIKSMNTDPFSGHWANGIVLRNRLQRKKQKDYVFFRVLFLPMINNPSICSSALDKLKRMMSFRCYPVFNPKIFSVSLVSSYSSRHPNLAFHSKSSDSPLSECVMMDYIFGKKKATEVAHSVWKHVVQKGDTVVDATCGNGYDTLAMVNMVSDKSLSGRVYAMDIQETAIKNTMSVLDGLHDPDEAATRIVAAGGVISIMVYVGHPGGMEEYEMVEGFASGLAVDKWICCKLQMLNRPLAPVLLFLCKR
ncbi:DNA-binding HORMA [Cynara cardunculus var. scolymus]|uniref:DNA-binding HORMA n=1 Tax=Cynara cardunculus var. scolymus TaxID=59895 RepID=A0A103XYJ4_CYNCS|nr:DNA-binding HORMA [Cynara cardunculus var. scolymus]